MKRQKHRYNSKETLADRMEYDVVLTENDRPNENQLLFVEDFLYETWKEDKRERHGNMRQKRKPQHQ